MNDHGPNEPRWTHVALPTGDVAASLHWYEAWTPLRCIHDREDAEGRTVWLSHRDGSDHPFVLVLIQAFTGTDEMATTLAPLAHLGFELPTRAAVDDVAARAAAAGILHWETVDLGPPVGYVCAVTDPDGNVVEFSHDQGVYDAARSASES